MAIDQNELLQALRNGALVDALNGLQLRPGVCMSMGEGVVYFGLNEQAIYATVDDPSALRLGSRTGGLGKLSGNLLVEHPEGWIIWVKPDGTVHRFREEELCLLQFKQDERVRELDPSDPRYLSGELTLHLRNGALPGDGMVKVLEIRHDGVEFCVPTNAGGGGSAPHSFLRSPNGQFDVEMQNDGMVTCYDEQDNHKPMWQIRKVDGTWQFVSLP